MATIHSEPASIYDGDNDCAAVSTVAPPRVISGDTAPRDPDGAGTGGGGGVIGLTRVDGKGLWRSWKRNFKHKLQALLDLIDNSLDASLAVGDADLSDFVGRVHIYPDKVDAATAARGRDLPRTAAVGVGSAPEAITSGDVDGDVVLPDRAVKTEAQEERENPEDPEVDLISSTINTGLVIVNNAIRPVRPLERVLEVYNSSKTESGADEIGENGVGLKQGCATLSDLSFVLVKNGPDAFVELGIVAESLQRAEGCYLPAFRFDIYESNAIPSLREQMTSLFSRREHLNVARCIAQYGAALEGKQSDLSKGIDRLLQHFDSILNFFDSDFVFSVVLDEISYGDTTEQRRSMETDPIRDLREVIPRTYLHVPPSFDFRVVNSSSSRERMTFQFWQQRLVEFSSFAVPVNERVPWRSLPSNGYVQSNEPPLEQAGTYKLRVFLGFDRMRMKDKDRTKAASMYIYSRASGRLILCEQDARFRLQLDSGGTMYSQCLTVLVDDIEGRLPLNPTKQDVAFGEQANGQIHSENLFIWVRAVTKFFYDYHLAKFGKQRTRLTARVAEFGSDPVQMQLKEVDRSHFTTFNARFNHYRNKNITIEQRSAKENVGPDTHFQLLPYPQETFQPFMPSEIASPVESTTVSENKRARIDPQQQALNYQCNQMQRVHNHSDVNYGVAEPWPQATQSASQQATPRQFRYPKYDTNHSNTVQQNYLSHPHYHPPQASQHLQNNHHAHSSNHGEQMNELIKMSELIRQQEITQQQQLRLQRRSEAAKSIQIPSQYPGDAKGSSSQNNQQAERDPTSIFPTGGQGKLPAITPDVGETFITKVHEFQDCSSKQLKAKSGTATNEVINLADLNDNDSIDGQSGQMVGVGFAPQQPEGNTSTESDINNDDDNSTGSTKEYYKDLCEKLVDKLESKNEDNKKKLKSLKKEIVELKKHIERQNCLLSQVKHS